MRKRVFTMYTLTNQGFMAEEPGRPFADPYIWADPKEATYMAGDGDMLQRVKVTIEPIGKARKPKS